ncbi:MAG TPA: nitrate ABC transporter substrate-binding protein, partial [Rhodospirillaceae bacterium]|nr:nitrate ABC transporter substrate-binding protein [Rhodospirillaceae bacterium]
VADPTQIVDGTREMHDFQLEIGTLKDEVDIDSLFDTSFYDGLK